MTLLKIENLSIWAGKKALLESINLEFHPRSWVSVIGPNGAGKTTLVEAISGVLSVPKATVSLGERDITSLSERERAKLVSFVPQSPVIPKGISLYQYLSLGRTAYQGAWRTVGPEDRRIVEEVADRLEIGQILSQEFSSLSGGERQRGILARALVQEASVLVLDEPIAGMDIRHQLGTLDLLRREVEEQDICIISTLHDLTLAGQYADRLVVLDRGQVALDGSASEIIRNPQLSTIYGARLEVVTIDGAELVIPAPN